MITIKAITEKDQFAFYDLAKRNQEQLADFFPITIEKTETREKTLKSIKLYQLLAQQNDLHVYMVEEEGSEIIGLLILKNIDKKVNKCELVYFIDKDKGGKGYASEAVKKVVNDAFNSLGMRKIYCRVATNDVASNRVAVKNGFELEGVLKKEFRIGNGQIIDINYYGLHHTK
jgi:RimJ/RimL family protein N-acetyltransferase